MKAILSIKPEFVEKILNGEKKYEYRKKVFKQDVESVIIYSTKPVGKFVGEFKIKDILCDNPNNIWEETNLSSGISHKYFIEYFNNSDTGYALEIEDLVVYKTPIEPNDIMPDFKAPQSFCYLRS